MSRKRRLILTAFIITDSYGDFSFNFATYVEGFFFKIFIYVCMYVSISVSVCVCIYGYVHMSTVALRGQRHQIPLAKVTSHCMCPMWMLGIRLGYSARAMWALIAKLSLALISFFLFSSMLLVKHSALNMLSISGTNESKQNPASGCSWQRVEMFSNIQPRLSSFKNSILLVFNAPTPLCLTFWSPLCPHHPVPLLLLPIDDDMA